jgi:hypothetical protein
MVATASIERAQHELLLLFARDEYRSGPSFQFFLRWIVIITEGERMITNAFILRF